MSAPNLQLFQRDFVAALLATGGGDGPSWARQPGWAVYRNTGLLACIDALEANYPVVAQLVGRDWLRSAAHDHARAHPPTDARLLIYGDGFAEFLADAARVHDLPYLMDVARLDRAWTESHVAGDAPVLSASDLAALPPQALTTLQLQPHPAARWLWCADAPAFTIWAHHREGDATRTAELDLTHCWQPEGALLTRPRGQVQWCSVGQAGCVLLQACAQGQRLPEALGAAASADPGADMGALLATLLGAGALSAPPSLSEWQA